MTKLEKVYNALLSMGYKAKMKGNIISIRGFRFIVKNESILVYNHNGKFIGGYYHMFNAFANING